MELTREEKPKLILLTGAGFSAGFGFPITNGLMELIKKPCEKPVSHFPGNMRYGYDSSPLKDFFSGDRPYDNFEYLLTVWNGYRNQLSQCNPVEAKKHEAMYHAMIKHLCCHFYSYCDAIQDNEEYRHEFILIAEWLSRATKTFDVRILTFNYDIVWERICEEAKIRYQYKIDDQSIGVMIRKLHGSMNWFEVEADPGNAQVSPRKVIHENQGKLICAYEGTTWPIYPSYRTNSDHPPMIAPSASKEYGTVFKDVWDDALKDLQTAHRVLVIGYSFPHLDAFAQHRLVPALFFRQEKKQIPVDYVLPDGNDLTRVKALLVSNRIDVEYHPHKWQINDFNRILEPHAQPLLDVAGKRDSLM
jgi:hypothetical protein